MRGPRAFVLAALGIACGGLAIALPSPQETAKREASKQDRGKQEPVQGELGLERLSAEIRAAADEGRTLLAHVEVRIDQDTNLHRSGVVVGNAERLVAVPFHAGFKTLERAYIRLLGSKRACLGYFVGCNADRSACFARLQFPADCAIVLPELSDAPPTSSHTGAFVVAVAPGSMLDATGQPELDLWTAMISSTAQSHRGRHGLLRLQSPLGPQAHGSLLVDPRGRGVGFVPDLPPLPESPDMPAQPDSKEPDVDLAEHALPLSRLRSDALEVFRAFREKHGAKEPDWPAKPWIGIYVWRPEFGTPNEAAPFAPFQILAVFEGSPAQRAGLLEGDVLTALNGVPLASSNEFMKGVKLVPSQPPHLLRMTVRRGDAAHELVAELNPHK